MPPSQIEGPLRFEWRPQVGQAFEFLVKRLTQRSTAILREGKETQGKVAADDLTETLYRIEVAETRARGDLLLKVSYLILDLNCRWWSAVHVPIADGSTGRFSQYVESAVGR